MDDTVALLERRMALMESQMESLDTSMRRLAEVGEFHMALSGGEDSTSDTAPAPDAGTDPAS